MLLFRNAVRYIGGPTRSRVSHFFKDQIHISNAAVWRSYPQLVLVAHCTQTVHSSPPTRLSSPTEHGDEADSDGQLQSGSTNEQPGTERGIGRFESEQTFRLKLRPDQPPDARILHVAIIGRPNCGKSSLTNRLMGWRISSVSKKVHTTRKNTTGIFTHGNVQIVFLDTPGILDPSHRRRHNLEKSLVIDPERSLHEADLVGVMVDVSDKWTRSELDPLILQLLHIHRDKMAVLILNKVDLLHSKELLLQMMQTLTQGIVDGHPVGVITKRTHKEKENMNLEQMFDAMQSGKTDKARGDHKRDSEVDMAAGVLETSFDDTNISTKSTSSVELSNPEHNSWMEYIRKMNRARRAVEGMKGWPHFRRVFMVSALSGDGVTDLKDYLMQSAKKGNWDYHSSLVTSQDPREVVTMCVKEKLLEHLHQEIPYNMDTDIVLMEVDEDGIFNVIMNVVSMNRRQVTFLLGPGGRTIQKIASEAKQEIMNAFHCEMRLKLVAKVRQQR